VQLAYIYQLINWDPRRIDKPTQFQGKFLLTPLLTSTARCDLGSNHQYSGEIIQFFRGLKDSSREFAIVFCESKDIPEESDVRSFLATRIGNTEVDYCGRAIWTIGSLDESTATVSTFLRNSKSLTADEFESLGKLKVAADAKGLGIVDTTEPALPPGERFSRIAQLLALSCAYNSILEQLINNLSGAGVQAGKAAEESLRKWSQFMSAFYFSEPVRQDTIELCRVYSLISSRQKISLLASEATEQLRLLAEVVRLDRSEAQADRERKIQFRLSALGLLIALLGLLQFTPKTIGDSFRLWKKCVNPAQAATPSCFGNPAQEPVIEGRPLAEPIKSETTQKPLIKK
jgi:hypothetical protein